MTKDRELRLRLRILEACARDLRLDLRDVAFTIVHDEVKKSLKEKLEAMEDGPTSLGVAKLSES